MGGEDAGDVRVVEDGSGEDEEGVDGGEELDGAGGNVGGVALVRDAAGGGAGVGAVGGDVEEEPVGGAAGDELEAGGVEIGRAHV